jgi:cyclophilin family peptidyl-prolyl cis-trans isomerase
MIEVALDAKGAPGTVNNFVVLSRYHYYDGSAIHRTDQSIEILQGGSPNTQSASDPGPGYTIEDEKCPPCTYTEGDLVMARTNDPDSAGAQFFFGAGPKVGNLDAQGTYVTFGQVEKGLDVVKAILALHEEDPTSGLGGHPSRPVIVKTVTIRES